MIHTHVIVLDTSGTMRQGFADEGPRVGRARPTVAATKFAAALEYLWFIVDNADREAGLLLVAFDSVATVIYDGPLRMRADIERAVGAVSPTGSTTDLSTALELVAARMKLAKASGGTRIGIIDVITDGLINDGDAQPAAASIHAQNGFITIYLIDDTTEGYAAVDRLIEPGKGKIERVRSAQALRDRSAENFAEREGDLESFNAAGANFNRQRADFQRQLPPDFSPPLATAAYPLAAAPNQWCPLDVYLYERQLRAVVDRQIRTRQRREDLDYASATSQLSSAIVEGARITVSCEAQGADVNPEEATVRWLEPYYHIPFRMRINARGMSSRGAALAIVMSVDDLPIGQITVQVGVTPDMRRSEHERSEMSWFQDVFASYAREDLDVAQQLRDRYAALGVFLFVDVDDLRSGASWRPDILDRIDRCDLFQLLWSQAAADSEFVAAEWKHALQLSPLKGRAFIRPIYWRTPLPPIPHELREVHFRRVSL